MHQFPPFRCYGCSLHHSAGSSDVHKNSSRLVQPERRHNTPAPLGDITQEFLRSKCASSILASFLLLLKLTGCRSRDCGLRMHPAHERQAPKLSAADGAMPGFHTMEPPLCYSTSPFGFKIGGPTSQLAINSLAPKGEYQHREPRVCHTRHPQARASGG